MKIIIVCGARPNFMKVAPLLAAMEKEKDNFSSVLVHTGQHYDYNMSKAFFEDLELPKPDIHLDIGAGAHGEQTGRTIIEFEKVLLKEKPDMVVVVGDVNSTLAAALAAVKLNIPISHIEAGLRSYDLTMPEEVNRLLTDQVADHLFTPSPDADANLKKEGIDAARIHRVGNIMVDCLLTNIDKARVRTAPAGLELRGKDYAVLTLHRPANVDVPETLEKLMGMILEVGQMLPVVFPVHPRTRQRLEESGSMGKLAVKSNLLLLIDPLRYLDFIALLMRSKFVMTDSGGIQPETTILGIPCLTLRDTTEWRVTLKQGTNVLVGDKAFDLIKQAGKIMKSYDVKKPRPPDLWDGKTAARIVNILKKTGK